MDGSSFLYHRVTRPAIQQFARLAINSNEQHPSHQRDAAQPPHTLSTPISPSQFHSALLSLLSSTRVVGRPTTSEASAPDASPATAFPAPLVDLILEYALCSSFIAAEADGAMHEYCMQDGPSEVRHWRAMHTDALTSVASLPDGQHCATAAHDGRIIVARHIVVDGQSSQWLEVRRIEHKYAVHTLQGVLAVDTSQSEQLSGASMDGSTPPSLMSALVVGSSAGVFVYCPLTGRMLHELSGHTNRVSALCVLPGSVNSASVVVSASWDGCSRVWSLQSFSCECVLRGQGKPLTCVTAVDRGCVVAGDVAGGVIVWQFAAAMRTATSASSLSQNAAVPDSSSPAPSSSAVSSIASISIAGHTSAAYVFRSPDTPSPPPVDLPTSLPSAHFSASSAATRSVLAVQSRGLLWVGSDDGLRLFAPSESGDWLCLRHILTPSPRGAACLPVHSLLWLSSRRMAVGMSKKLEVWNCQPLLDSDDTDVQSAAGRVACEWTELLAERRVRSLAARQWIDITQQIH